MTRAALLAALLLAVLAAPAVAQAPGDAGGPTEELVLVVEGDVPPVGHRRTADEVRATARAVPRIRDELRDHPSAVARTYLRDPPGWQVSFHASGRRGAAEVAQVLVDDRTGRVREAWTGVQVQWTMARGYEGAFGRQAGALYVWLPLLLAFLLPFLRPPWRLLHLDLAVLAALSVSFASFSRADIDASVPLAYPPLVYLLLRLLAIAWSRGRPGGPAPRAPLRLTVGPDLLVVGIVFLLGFRLGLQVFASNVIDVGYAGLIGADRIAGGEPLYGAFPADNPRGDTYGPLTYLVYVPFELVWPWTGSWDDLPGAHAAAAAFDLTCVALLWWLGRRARGPRLGLLLAYLWLACPFTLLAANSGTNDALAGALVLAALVAAAHPVRRGALAAAAGFAKFAPLALLPLFALHRPPDGPRRVAGTAVGAAVVAAGSLGLVLALDGSLTPFLDRTLGFQAQRESPFSLWGLYELPGLQRIVQAAAIALALAVAFLPRRRDLVSLAALTAAVLIAAQLGVTHWFYLYVPWFLGPLLLALLGPYEDGPGRSTGSIASARPGEEQRTSTALSHGSSVAAS